MQEKEAALLKTRQYQKEKNKSYQDQVKSLSNSLEETTNELIASQKYIADKTKVSDDYVSSLSSALEEKENYIAELSSALEEKENYIIQLESTKLVKIAKDCMVLKGNAMHKICFFSIVSKNYTHVVRTLMDSVEEHYPKADRIVALCDQQNSFDYSQDNFSIFSLEELDNIPQIKKFCFVTRS